MTRLTLDNINHNVVKAEYAVRGELALKSEAYRHQLLDGVALPFDSIISCNIGNPQQLGQKPITFFRQVLSLLENPGLLEHHETLTTVLGYPEDVIERARWQLSQIGSVGAYSPSAGVPAFKGSIANFLEKRDGFQATPEHIYLSAGASSAVNIILHIICAGESTGVLVPIPQYPLYTALLSIIGATCVPYYLDETADWSTSIESIQQAYNEAKNAGIDVRALVSINPGNPTGVSLEESNVRQILEFSQENKLVVLADEVYQTNVFDLPFHSFRKVLLQMQHERPDQYHIELASIHSISKGMVGECGHRGGFFELIGFDPAVEEQVYKFVSITLCAPVIGQCLVEMMVNPPAPGSQSYDLYRREYDSIANTLRERAYKLYHAFQAMEGVQCAAPQGSMYLFPTIHMPSKAAEKAREMGKEPDAFYCSRLLDATGICVVPGSGFGQVPGSQHFRVTFLAPGTEWVDKIQEFHRRFMDEYR